MSDQHHFFGGCNGSFFLVSFLVSGQKWDRRRPQQREERTVRRQGKGHWLLSDSVPGIVSEAVQDRCSGIVIS